MSGFAKALAIDAALAVAKIARLRAVPILMYHSLDDESSGLSVPVSHFRDQMAWLRDHGGRTVTLDEYADALNGPGLGGLGRAVVVTFDDGYVNNFEHALPVLERHGFTATLFIATGCVGEMTPWLEHDWPVMTWDQIRTCREAGHSIGAHTVTHPHLSELPRDEARREMAESKDTLEERLGEEVRWLCYPFGSFTPETEAIAREVGFRGAVSVNEGLRNRPEDLFRLRRVYIGPETDLRHFAFAMTRFHGWRHG
ncbi:polysaccharide deacetylase family protein [Candidatus Sumerlaeota bacterium]|nr:polysaccharide deacetylase family protein [Candidatus Sumerlaeota bacterium]